MILEVLIAALAVLPADRLAMADRLFNRGRYAEAEAEYRALKGIDGISPDIVIFRLAECARAAGAVDRALGLYHELVSGYPDSEFAPKARLQQALAAKGDDRRRLLTALDSDRIDNGTRAIALYHLGAEANDVSALEKCAKIDPKGRYADYANLRRGALMNASGDPKERRKGVDILLGIAFSGGALADEALYLAAMQSYRDHRYSEAGTLMRRYCRTFPQGPHAAETRKMSVWCDYMNGRFADAAAACGDDPGDDFTYLRAACAYAIGDNPRAKALFRVYLENHPSGRYRRESELPIARIEFEEARKADNASRCAESAQRAFALSGAATDELRLAWAYEKLGNVSAAEAEYAKVMKSFPSTAEAAEAAYSVALIAARAGNWSKAELAFAEALATGKLAEHRPTALYWRGVAAMKLGHEAEACVSLRQAVEAGLSLDEDREARLMIADVDLRAGRTDAAKLAYTKLLENGAAERMSASRLKAVGELLFGEPGAMTCAEALVKSSSAAWRQLGYVLLGRIREREGAFAAAMAAYRSAFAEKTPATDESARALLSLGELEYRAGEYTAAAVTLGRAVEANGANPGIRARAYLTLAKNSLARKDVKGARGYATVVTALFDDRQLVAEAEKLLRENPEEGGE